MKPLASSADLDDLTRVIKRLISVGIPCAVCKGSLDSHLSVWVQRDDDFPLALRAVVNRQQHARLPYWARALEPTRPAPTPSALPIKTSGAPPQPPPVESPTTTRTGTAFALAMRQIAQHTPA